ncbi:MAG: ArsR family transcriptional regulator [Candidatus Aureabacteria bacterium]|nr:ArsR family transcriptional regulator [Candidatus Auribacterota bacterium]
MLEKEVIDWQLYKFVIRGKRRASVLKALHKDLPKTPTQLKKQLSCWFNSSDRSLMELVKKGLVICLNSEDKTGKLYVLTETGEKIKELILKSENIQSD